MLEINSIVFVNIALLALILIVRKNNPLPNIILGLVIFTPGLNFLNNINILTEHIYSFPYTYFIVQATGSLFAPLFYVYIQLFLNKPIFKRKWLYILTGITFLIPIYLAVDFYFYSPAIKQDYIFNLTQENYPESMVMYGVVMFILQLIYATICVVDIYKSKKTALKTISNTEKIKIKFLEILIFIIWIFTALVVVLYEVLPANYVEYVILPLVLLVINTFIFYYAFNFNVVFSESSFSNLKENMNEMNEIELEIASAEQTEIPTNASSIKDEIAEKIEASLTHKKIFTNQNLNLSQLSKEIGYPTHQTSKTINQSFNKTFSDLIQEHRIQYAIELLNEKSDKLSMEGIAYEAGFNSRASFYRSFKKITGKTPTEFQKS